MAVEIRNRLSAIFGLKLPTTLLFDHPTPDALASKIQNQIPTNKAGATVQTSISFDNLETTISSLCEDTSMREEVVRRLMTLLAKWARPRDLSADALASKLRSVTNEELLRLCNMELEVGVDVPT
jgi:hypothetical protein